MLKLLLVLHWIGFLMTLAMSVLSFMDQSKDEYMIHIIASSMPLLFTWLLRKAMAGPCRLFPFLKNNIHQIEKVLLIFLYVKRTLHLGR